MTAVGFEPTPFRTAALTQRLRPLGHTVDEQSDFQEHTYVVMVRPLRAKRYDGFAL